MNFRVKRLKHKTALAFSMPAADLGTSDANFSYFVYRGKHNDMFHRQFVIKTLLTLSNDVIIL